MNDSDEHARPPGARDPWNTLLWQPDTRRPHVESLFLKLYVPDQRQALWLQFGARSFEKRVVAKGAGAPHAHVMAARFCAAHPERNLALKRRFQPSAVESVSGRLDVRMGGCILEDGHTAGALEADGHAISWDLEFESRGAALYHLPWSLLYRTPLPKTKASSPAPDARFRGWFEVDGRRVEVKNCPGMQGHNWGREHAPRWRWVHANQLSGSRPEAAEAVFEGLSARIRLPGGIESPWLSFLQLRYGHLALRFDTLSHPFAVKSEPEELGWKFVAGDRHFRLTGRASADADQFIGVHYPNTDGRTVHCANASASAFELVIETRDATFVSSGADAATRGRWRTVDTLCSAEAAALEIAGPTPAPGVRELVTS